MPTGDQPDFALIYAFLGSLFDPACASFDHMDVLDQMKDIDRQTATLLMRNVISNLQNPEVSTFSSSPCRLCNSIFMVEHLHSGKFLKPCMIVETSTEPLCSHGICLTPPSKFVVDCMTQTTLLAMQIHELKR